MSDVVLMFASLVWWRDCVVDWHCLLLAVLAEFTGALNVCHAWWSRHSHVSWYDGHTVPWHSSSSISLPSSTRCLLCRSGCFSCSVL